ncbi:MAG: kynureninase [Solirubrobacteraceae bacterium]
MIHRQHAEALDAHDPLREFRELFDLPADVIYLDGNSLGPLPLATRLRLRRLVDDEWGDRLIRGWDEGWMDLPVVVGDRLGALVGAAPGQVVVGDSTSVCFYKLACAALDLRPGRTQIVTDTGNFPTDRYVLEGIAQARGLEIVWLESDPSPESVLPVLSERTALVSFSQVSYRTAFMADMAAITSLARDAGALMLWDLSHAVGSVLVSLDADGADLAVGCTYKYLNGGPGAPAFMYVRGELLPEIRQPIWGWLGRREPFEMASGYESAEDIRRLLSGTPSVLGLAAVDEGVALVERAGMDRIRAKGMALTELAIGLVDARLSAFGVSVASPRDRTRRGAHIAITHPGAQALCAAMINRGVIVDFRRPDLIRLGLSPLVTRFVDVWDGVEVLREVLAAPA